MRSNTMKRSLVVTGLALALPFGLAACGGDDKPSKEDVLAGFDQMLAQMGMDEASLESFGVSGEQMDNYASCIVDDIYGEVSADLLNAVADGDAEAQVDISEEDEEVVTDAVESCQGELGM